MNCWKSCQFLDIGLNGELGTGRTNSFTGTETSGKKRGGSIGEGWRVGSPYIVYVCGVQRRANGGARGIGIITGEVITPEAPGGGLNHLSKALAELLKCTNLDWKAFTCKPGEEQYRWATGMKIRGRVRGRPGALL